MAFKSKILFHELNRNFQKKKIECIIILVVLSNHFLLYHYEFSNLLQYIYMNNISDQGHDHNMELTFLVHKVRVRIRVL